MEQIQQQLTQRIMTLSRDQLELLAVRLKQQGIDIDQAFILPQRRDGNVVPASYAQRRLWFLDQYEPETSLYNIPLGLRLRGSLNVSMLQTALNEVVGRHEVLRTTFAEQDGSPVQIIASKLYIPIRIEDLRHLSADEQAIEVARYADEESQRPFDLMCGPLLRVQMLRLASDEYILLLTIHHIVADGWSVQLLVREMIQAYAALDAGHPIALPPLPIQYADFSQWQQHYLQGNRLAEQIDYWRDQLGGHLPVLELPTDHARPSRPSHRGATCTTRLSADLTRGLHALSRQENGTLFTTLLSAFAVLLHRYTGQTDFCIGTPIANRNRAEIENLIGFFVNTLAMRANLEGNPSFRDALRRMRKVALDAYDHQDLPFEMVVDAVQPERMESYSPLFQVMFVLQNTPSTNMRLPNLSAEQMPTPGHVSRFDLTLNISESDVGLDALLEYSSDLFEPATADRLLRHLGTLLESVVADPDQAISDLAIMDTDELQRVLVEWNATAAPFSDQVTFHRLFEQQAQATPDVPAVVIDGEISYGELNSRANQLARRLVRLGVGPDRPVGVCIERSIDMITALLAALKAGGAYLPLDPTYPAQRLAFMLADSGAEVLLTQAHLRELLPTEGVHTLCVDAERTITEQEDGSDLDTAVTPDHLAYVIYTSGSTGQPKGVMIPHRGVLNLLAGLEQAVYQRHPSGGPLRASLNAPLSFDASVQQLVLLLRGDTLYVLPDEIRADGEALLRYIREQRLDVLDCVPTQLKLLLAAGLLDGTGWAPSIILPGGEAIDAVTWRTLAEAPETAFYNMYGPTECTVDATTCRADDHPEGPVIGRPLANRTCYVLDEYGQPVPIGVPGELHIGGEGLARGYLNRAELTAERFVADPFRGEPGARMYRSGDLVRYLADGQIEFLGRVDHQVKVRGHRIELGEIENLLRGHADVAEATVIVREDVVGDQRLVAYVVCADGQQCQPLALRQHLEAQLPDYMVPGSYVQLQAMPLTPNGKIDRQALPAPGERERSLSVAYAPPRSPMEEMLCELWAQVLGIGQVGIHDNFFELGGHSLLATQLASRVRTRLNVDLPLRRIFEAPTIAKLAERIDIARRSAHGIEEPPIERAPRDGDLPLSFAQQRLWFLAQLEPDSPFYNMSNAVAVKGALDLTVLRRVLDTIVQRHESLRTNFVTVDGRPVQRIHGELTIDLPIVDLDHLSPDEQKAEVERRLQQEATQPFDLATDPLLRVVVLRLAESEHVILLTMHHIISDNWSSTVLMQEIATLYDAFSQDAPSPLPELPIQYADFGAWQRGWLQGEVRQKMLDYWREQLAGAPPLLELPTDRPRPPVQTFNGAYHEFMLSEELTSALQTLNQREGTTLFMTLMAAFQTLLHRYSGQDDISVGTVIANRNRAAIERLIGFFVNTIVIRSRLEPGLTFRELLQRVRETSLGAYAHQDLPFEALVDALQPQRDLSHSPLSQVMLVLQNVPQGHNSGMTDLDFQPLSVHSGTTKFDLTLFATQIDDRLRGAIEYNTDLFDAATITRMARHFERLLEAIVEDPDGDIRRLPILPEDERQQVLADWNKTAIPFHDQITFHRLFEQQAQATPDIPAVVIDGEISYEELNARANRLARRLVHLGVGPDRLVGVCIERSIDMVTAVLGVLKAGGAYLPLDPTYPTQRLAFMLADSGAQVLLTQAHLRDLLPTESVRTLCVDADRAAIAQEDASNLPSITTPDNLAYVIYTSGSTGQPKGVMIPHRGVLNLLAGLEQAIYQRHPHHQPLRASLNAPLSFDASVQQLVLLLRGDTLYVLPDDIRVDGNELLRYIREHRLDVLDCVPTQLKLLLATGLLDGTGWAPSIILPGGEAIDAMTWRTLAEAPGTAFYNMYGPTECTVDATTCRVDDHSEVPVIGRPLANRTCYVLDEHRQPAPIGVPGELYIGGEGLAKGYLNQPELTAERFVADPFRKEPGARIYRTGDLVRYLANGQIEFLGRVDHQVKVRGYRIELGEIESALGDLPGIEEQVVIVREDVPGHQRLVAYIVADGAGAPPVNEMREHLEARLPDYMVPVAFVTLPEMPLTPNRKIDRGALPAPDFESLGLTGEYEAPRNEREWILAEIWCELLGVERVGVHDAFFELGGDSILSIQMISRVSQRGLQLTPKQVFQHPTIAELAMVAGTGPTIHAEQGIVTGDVPFTPVQRRFLELDLIQPWHWNQAVLLQVQQPLAPNRLQQACEHLVAHHDALRHRFERTDAGWRQVAVEAQTMSSFARVDLSSVADGELSAAIEAEANRWQRSFDLANGPLFRLVYIDLGGDRPGRLLAVAHHLVMDGVSWRIVFEDLQRIYDQMAQGQPVTLPLKTTSFKRWAETLVHSADEHRDELSFWLAQQKSAALLRRDLHDGENTVASSRMVHVSLDADETETLLNKTLAAYRAEIDALLLTALAHTVANWSHTSRIAIELEGHGRGDIAPDIDVSRTVGWFTALYPIAVPVSKDGDLVGTLRLVKEQLRQVPRDGIGYGCLRYLDPHAGPQLDALPQPEISFNYLGRFDQTLKGDLFRLARESTGLSLDPQSKRSTIIDINGGIADGQLTLAWTYSAHIHRADTINRLAHAFVDALRALIRQSQAPQPAALTPSDFPLAGLRQRELDKVLSRTNMPMRGR